jgi:hypothetical protein
VIVPAAAVVVGGARSMAGGQRLCAWGGGIKQNPNAFTKCGMISTYVIDGSSEDQSVTVFGFIFRVCFWVQVPVTHRV